MNDILVGMTPKKEKKSILLPMANRHGLIAGATGTGKTVTLQTIAEQCSRNGVSVFMADVKGDISGIAAPGLDSLKIKQARDQFDNEQQGVGCPTIFWDIYGQTGQPLRTTISEMGPMLLARLLNANETQQGIINAAFSLADDQGLLLLDLKDFRSLIDWMSDHAESLRDKYGNITKNSTGAIQRALLTMQEAGGDKFFGEPALKLEDFLQKDDHGNGYVNILDATKLVNDPRLYSTFLLWLLSELFEKLPELGDVAKPRLIFFFDEAHLLFNTAPKILIDKLEQVVRLIRSKGVGVFFITQSPLDITESILGQLSNRVQHALRAFTPKDQKAVKTAAQTFRQNPKLDTTTIISELGVGEALVSFLDDAGVPSMVEKIQVMPPLSRIGSITEVERAAIRKKSPSYGFYDTVLDRESAFEVITKKTLAQQAEVEKSVPKEANRSSKSKRNGTSTTGVILKSTAKILNSRIGQQIIRGVLGSIFGGKRK